MTTDHKFEAAEFEIARKYCAAGDADSLRKLVAGFGLGADFAKRDNNALIATAIKHGHVNVMMLLRDVGEITLEDISSCRVSHGWPVAVAPVAALKTLRKVWGASARTLPADRTTALLVSAFEKRKGEREAIVELLVNWEFDIKSLAADNAAPIKVLVKSSAPADVAILKAFRHHFALEKGVSLPEAIDNKVVASNILRAAITRGNLAMIEELREWGFSHESVGTEKTLKIIAEHEHGVEMLRILRGAAASDSRDLSARPRHSEE